MFLVLVVTTLIVYGLTLLVVQGTIFNGLKTRLSKHIDKLHAVLNPTDEEVLGLIESSHKSISKKLLKLYQELGNKVVTTDASHEKFNSLLTMYDEAKAAAKKQIYKYYNRFYITRLRLWCAKKLQKLTSCMMCMGFWNGVIVCLLSSCFSISICCLPLTVITTTGFINFTISTFLMACLLSGTTWAIHSVVDTLDEIKQRLGDIIDKR